MTIGALDTDSAALRTRLALQEKLSSFDLNQWVFSHFPYEAGQRWLDIGCGTGKQSIPLAKAGCAVTAVDASAESLAVLRAETAQVRTICCDMDAFEPDQSFDRALASYSLYYAIDPERLIRKIAQSLKPDGQLFFCGPSHTNNMELRTLVADVTGNRAVLDPTGPSVFMEKTGQEIARYHFAGVQTFSFENAITYSSVDDLVAYWSSHNLYDPVVDDAFREAVEAMPFPFLNRKRGIGVRAWL
jgi:SAM-dependent methyltransferase